MFATVMESGDHGPFNSWDRQVYSHELNLDGSPNLVKKYDEIRFNYFMGNYYGTCHNIALRCSSLALLLRTPLQLVACAVCTSSALSNRPYLLALSRIRPRGSGQ